MPTTYETLEKEAKALRLEIRRLRYALSECITEDGALAWRNAQFAGQRLEAISRIAKTALSNN